MDLVLKSKARMHGWLLMTAFGLFLILLSLLAYINTGSIEMLTDVGGMFTEGKIILLGIIVTVYWVYFVTWYFDKMYQHNLLSIQRYLYEFLIVVLGGYLINYAFHYIFIKLVVVPEPDAESLTLKLNNLLITNQVLMVIIYAVIAAFKTLQNLKEKQNEIARIQKEVLQSQFETLKNQLNPDFLFNSLSALASLVHVNADKAEIFIDKLSRTYRYLLDQREKEIVPLDEEINFFENFSYVLHERYGRRLSIFFSKNDEPANVYLLPHTFLIVIEYILATNNISLTHPLAIDVKIENGYLLIRHKLAHKISATVNMEVPQRELQKSYQRMGKQFATQTDEFEQTVLYKISLINPND
jgi:hypothetical protein